MFADPNVQLIFSKNANGDEEGHVIKTVPDAWIPSDQANPILAKAGLPAMPDGTQVQLFDLHRQVAAGNAQQADRAYTAKIADIKFQREQQLKAQEENASMARTRFVQGQENSRAAGSAATSVDSNSLANATPNASGVRGDYLNSLPAGVQAQVKAIGEGRMAPPNARTKIGKELADQVASAYPNYDATKFPAYQKMRQDFTSGKTGQGLNALNTAIEHLGVMSDNASLTSTLPGLSAIERATGDQQANNFKMAQHAATDEVGKAYKQGVLSESEQKQWQSDINSWRSYRAPSQRPLLSSVC